MTLPSLYDLLSDEDKKLAQFDILMLGTCYLQQQEDGSVKCLDPRKVWNDPKPDQ